MPQLNALAIALLFLTRIPAPPSWLPQDYTAELRSRAVLFYPAVGVLIGLVLLACAHLLLLIPALPMLVSTCIILMLWVALTGALHLDGLADSIDAYYASHKGEKITLEVFRDPNIGAMAMVWLALSLLLKISIIFSLMAKPSALQALVWAPLAARLLVIFYMQYTPYVRPDGIASNINLEPFKTPIQVLCLATLLFFFFSTNFFSTILLIALLTLTLLLWRRLWVKLIGGYTGDCAGALIEIAELLTLLALLILL